MDELSRISSEYGRYMGEWLDAEITGKPHPERPKWVDELLNNVREYRNIKEDAEYYCPICGTRGVWYYPNRTDEDEDNLQCKGCDKWFSV